MRSVTRWVPPGRPRSVAPTIGRAFRSRRVAGSSNGVMAVILGLINSMDTHMTGLNYNGGIAS